MLEIQIFWKKILYWTDIILRFTEMGCLKVIALKYLNTSGKLLIEKWEAERLSLAMMEMVLLSWKN